MYIETERTIIRDFTMDDLKDLQEILGDDETMKNCEPAYSVDKTERFLREFCIERKGAFAAEHKDTGKVIGYILFNEYEAEVYEMGWFFNRAFWRQNLAYESCKAIIDFAFGNMKVHKIFAETTDKIKSVNLMKKLGMTMEGIQRSQTKDGFGNWTDLYFYGILAEDRE
ncbi:MAG: GNAT family N-acetyltransferase [Clostridia bacterium]|nr:GNAT family N-acetyltransferase [Clostridia bacterium]